MEQQDKNNYHPQPLENEYPVANDARPVCPNCLAECNPLQEYCDKCGDPTAAINPLTPYLPFVNIRFNYGGFMRIWRNVVTRKTPLVVKIFNTLVLLVIAPIVILISLPFWLFNRLKTTH